MDAAALVADWAGRGSVERVGDDSVFVVDTRAAQGSAPPLLVLHGYPTSSIDFAAVLGALGADRRVVLPDFPGFGLSAKPDRAYSLFAQADVVEAVVAGLGIDEVDLLTHDMGDSVGGELLARSIDGKLGFSVRRRVLTNGSIYLDLAHLTDGQQLLASLPDEAIDADSAPDVDALERALNDTLGRGSASRPDPMHVRAGAVLVVHEGGNRLLARQIRYIEERRKHESRWTGAIEQHPAPLTIVWGDHDPIAVWGMTDELIRKRGERDTPRHRLEGVGHYPMVEAPAAFADAVLEGLR
jgi:pimeloyl-ACP methyl ester carboxylesterase